ncbi:MAG: hypothetical protein HW421_1847 [Ignavibacteria bacterium]|nr:hypothetical protein [Ignavibacteria bacterium]
MEGKNFKKYQLDDSDFKFQMNGEEFKFIRERYGLSRRQLGEFAGKLIGKQVSSKTIYNWELKKKLNYMQIHLLRNSMPPDMFDEARREWENFTGILLNN